MGFGSIIESIGSIFSGDSSGEGGLFNFIGDMFGSGGPDSFGMEDWIGPALMAGTSLVSGLYGQDADQYAIDQKLAFDREQLAQQKELTEAQIKAQIQAAEIAAGAAKKAARTRAVTDLLTQNRQAQLQATGMQLKAIEGKPELIQNQAQSTAEAYRKTGQTASNAFNNLITAVQRPLLRG